LLASVIFYAAAIPEYLLVLAAMILIDYTAGLVMANAKQPIRTIALWTSIFSNCALLFFFKYAGFFIATCLEPFDIYRAGDLPQFVLPIGLSFHTFQSLSYVIEVYRGRAPVEYRLDRYALYVLFFPQLVAGPIERPQNLLHQFQIHPRFNPSRFISGSQLVLWGAFKKIVIADRLGYLVDAVYSTPETMSGTALSLATICFAVQIYCDFSGYSDIAIGTARIMGIALMRNFDRPYSSASVTEFWRRWHISLSSWFRDYLYIPLGGNRGSRARQILCIMITFSFSGLWHGANWSFIAWGALNGIFVIFESFFRRASDHTFSSHRQFFNVPKTARQILTFSAICTTWVFFRSKSVSEAMLILSRIFSGSGTFALQEILAPLFTEVDIAISAGAVMALLVFERYSKQSFDAAERVAAMASPLRWAFYISVTLAIFLLGIFDSKTFIYFQF
jgi:D-alanyl-lipoteichoic acid acyltransferase DltB (MBOAT superfamily)